MGLLKVIGKEGTEEGNFKYPCGITIDSHGCFIASDSDNNRIQVMNTDGVCEKVVTFTQFTKDVIPFAVAQWNGTYFVTDRGNNQVVVTDSKWDLIRVFGNGELHDPRGVCVSPVNGHVYVANYERDSIEGYTVEGVHTSTMSFDAYGSGKLDGPVCVDIDNSGKIFVADHDNHCIQVYGPDHQHLYVIGCQGQGEGQLCFPRGVVVDSEGSVYVSDEKSSVQKFNGETGELISRLDSNEQLNWPCGIALTSDTPSSVVVADSSNHCIKIFSQ